jgi:hypothetical protein
MEKREKGGGGERGGKEYSIKGQNSRRQMMNPRE